MVRNVNSRACRSGKVQCQCCFCHVTSRID